MPGRLGRTGPCMMYRTYSAVPAQQCTQQGNSAGLLLELAPGSVGLLIVISRPDLNMPVQSRDVYDAAIGTPPMQPAVKHRFLEIYLREPPPRYWGRWKSVYQAPSFSLARIEERSVQAIAPRNAGSTFKSVSTMHHLVKSCRKHANP